MSFEEIESAYIWTCEGCGKIAAFPSSDFYSRKDELKERGCSSAWRKKLAAKIGGALGTTTANDAEEGDSKRRSWIGVSANLER